MNNRARFINEKFTEDSDAIHDMGIGEVEYQKLINAYKDLDQYMNFDVEDLEFAKVIGTLEFLRRISAYNVAMFFNKKYDFYVKINPNNYMGGVFAEGAITGTKYFVQFSTSGPGKMVGVAICDEQGGGPIKTGTRMRSYGASYQYQVDQLLEGSSRTIHGLDGRFRNYCKQLDIDITTLEK